jgi:hypothetical protein
MVLLPGAVPQLSPALLMAAMAAALLLHAPPAVASVKVVQLLTHILDAPSTGDIGFTVIALVTWQLPMA